MRKLRLTLRHIAALCILFQLSSCATLQQLVTVPQRKPLELSTERLPQRAPERYLNTLAASLLQYVPVEQRTSVPHVDVGVLATSRVQGMAHGPAPRISITRGFLNVIQNEAELAALLGHEIGHHVLHRDSASSRERHWSSNHDLRAMQIAQWSRGREQEADEFGVMLAAQAGYAPYALADLFRRLDDYHRKGFFAILSSARDSHKDFGKRAAHIERFLQERGFVREQGRVADARYRRALSLLHNISGYAHGADMLPGGSAGVVSRVRHIKSELAASIAQQRALSPDRYFAIVTELQRYAQGFLSPSEIARVRSNISHNTFMKEILHQDVPLWDDGALAQEIREVLTLLGRTAVGSVPIVGDGLDLYELIVGRDFWTGEALSPGERVITAAAISAGNGKVWREGAARLQTILQNRQLRSAVSTRDAKRAVEQAGALAEQSQHWGVKSTNELNRLERLKGPDRELPYKPNSYVVYRTTRTEEAYYRVYREDRLKEGRWIMTESPLYMSPRELKESYALPAEYNQIAKVTVPPGTEMRVSIAGENVFGKGGKMQFELRNYNDAIFETIVRGD